MERATIAGYVLAALETLPAQPSDLTGLIESLPTPTTLRELISVPAAATSSPELWSFLQASVTAARVEQWASVLRHGDYDWTIAGSEGYPTNLARAYEAPPILFTRGDASLLVKTSPRIAIVGSRETSTATLEDTLQVAGTVAASGVIVVSGMALGVDGAAHRGALDAGGDTIGVLGTGIERVFPAQHSRLFEEVQGQGVIVSQFAPSAPRTPTSFLWRNRVIAGLSDVSLAMDAGATSGTRNEIEAASEFGRPVLLWEPTLSMRDWARAMVRDGKAHFVANAEQVLERLGSAQGVH